LSQERLYTSNNIIYEDRGSIPQARTQLGSRNNSECRDSNIDVNLKRKVDKNLKWFTSQISELPGPKKNLVRNIGQEYRTEQKEELKLAEEKNKIKNRQLLGALYQDNKYCVEHKPSRAYRTYVKGVKSEWNRNPQNEHTKKMREKLIYGSLKLS
jgi:hypothetical protein